MYKVFGYGLEDIPYINRLKRRVFCAITLTILSLNIFISFSLNLRNLAEDTRFNSFVVVDLQNNLDEKKKNEIENYTQSLAGVKFVRFMDKSESFKNLQKELNISIPESSNPLTDSLIVSVKDSSYLNTIQETLEAREEVKEVYKDELFLNQSEQQSLVSDMAQIGSAVFAVFTAIITIIIFNLGVAIEFLNNANTGLSYSKNVVSSKRKSLFHFTLASIVGTLIFFNLYLLFRKFISSANFNHTMLSIKEIILWNIGAILILNILVYIIPANVGKIEYDNDDFEDEDEEYDDEYTSEFEVLEFDEED